MINKVYDYLIVGAGLYGALFSFFATKDGKKCLVVDRRNHIGGNCYTEDVHGINVHKYGPHIFRTNDKQCWDFVNSLCEFSPFVNSPMAEYKGKLYNLPFNMNTFNQMWGATTPQKAKEIIESQSVPCDNPKSIEDFALSVVGRDIYEYFVKSYTKKQWGCECKHLPAEILKRLPIRMTYDNNYHSEKFQGIPVGGYEKLFSKLLEDSELLLGVDFNKEKSSLPHARKIVYTGRIDEYFSYAFGKLGYRAVDFHHIYLADVDNYQGVAVVNHTGDDCLYTRTIEHKHFEKKDCKGTVITYEFPHGVNGAGIACYPLNDDANTRLLKQYKEMAAKETNVIFGGRLADYAYYNMNDIVERFIDGEYGDKDRTD